MSGPLRPQTRQFLKTAAAGAALLAFAPVRAQGVPKEGVEYRVIQPTQPTDSGGNHAISRPSRLAAPGTWRAIQSGLANLPNAPIRLSSRIAVSQPLQAGPWRNPATLSASTSGNTPT